MKYFYLLLILSLIACKKEKAPIEIEKIAEIPIVEKIHGFIKDDFKIIESEVQKNETFGVILDRNHVENPLILKIVNATKSTFDIARNLRVKKKYIILATKDSLEKAQVFIYKPNRIETIIYDFRDSISAKIIKKEIKTVIKTASGEITSNLSNVIEEQGINYGLTYAMSDIYAWTIDFYHLQKGDKFKVIYEEKFIDDTTSVAIGDIKAAYFEHHNKPFYSFRFLPDTITKIPEYFDEKATNLRRAFLKAPLKFSSRVSSRYNLKRRIKHYNYKVRPHRGTDFPSPIGTPIISTANGKVVKSAYKRRGNGNYVKIKHNNTYSTQYLHMQKRKVKVGDFVKQGDIIGWIGMTGSTGGPHVCYRFWKNGKQVDPFRQKLPAADPMKEELKKKYFEYIKSIKSELDSIKYKKIEMQKNLELDKDSLVEL